MPEKIATVKKEKLKSSPSAKSASQMTATKAPSSGNASSIIIPQRTRSARQTSQSSNLVSALLFLSFAACFLQIFLTQPDFSQQHHQPVHWFDHSLWTLDNSTVNRNIMGVDLTAKDTSSKAVVGDQPNKQQHHNRKADISNDEHPILALLRNAGIEDLTEEDKQNLPDWKALQSLYGDLEEPLIIGLETCATYRNMVPPPQRYAAVAGLFNTGTNAMQHHLEHNINMKSAWQVPWGKHRMEFVRLNHTAPGLETMDRLQVLPIVLIRDPYHWLHSMCKSPYATHWKHRPVHCPNLVPDEEDRKRYGDSINETFPVKVIFDKDQVFYWASLAHLWSDWYQYYFKATYPRLMIRFEDMVLHAPTIMKIIAECTGTTVPDKFTFQAQSSKSHGSGATFLKVVEKTGDIAGRVDKMTKEDLVYAEQHLDENLMKVFKYIHPDNKL